jgi:hypothetical protein
VPMHRGAVLATLTCSLLVLAVGIWALMGPMFVGGYTIAMINPRTHERLTCRASFAPADQAFRAVDVCKARCEAYGFRRVDGGPPFTSAYDEPLTEIERRWGKFIPAACKERAAS